jgi:hypothetical protein
VREQPTNDIQLVIARKNLFPLLLSRLRVRNLHDLRVFIDDVRQTFLGENLLP